MRRRVQPSRPVLGYARQLLRHPRAMRPRRCFVARPQTRKTKDEASLRYRHFALARLRGARGGGAARCAPRRPPRQRTRVAAPGRGPVRNGLYPDFAQDLGLRRRPHRAQSAGAARQRGQRARHRPDQGLSAQRRQPCRARERKALRRLLRVQQSGRSPRIRT